MNLLTGTYAGCANGTGSGCARGDYRSGSDATVMASAYMLVTPTAGFTSADVGKSGVAVDWGANIAPCSGAAWFGWACYTGVSRQFIVTAVSGPTSISVSPVTGCGSSGMGFNAAGHACWAIYTDDSTALQNALNAAASYSPKTLFVPPSYQGGIFQGAAIPDGVAIQCAAGASFNDPRPDASTTWLLTL